MASFATIEITPTEISKAAALAEKIIYGIAAEFGNGRKGGYIYICDAAGTQLLHEKLGEPDPEKMHLYEEFSKEKPERLLRNPKHVLSWQSRNPGANQWGGAIRLPSGHIVSFSGLPELCDEAFCATLAYILNWATQAQLEKLLRISGNISTFLEVSSYGFFLDATID